MKYGCIGEHLQHSFSAKIHALLADYEYEIKEITPSELEKFARSADFSAVNVTIPYKEAIIPYLSEIDEIAKMIGSVNTVVNRDGRLYGYNTDFYGMCELIRHAKINISGKRVAVLGTGGTSKTAVSAAISLGAKSVIRVSRSAKDGAVIYERLYSEHKDTEIIINTTPVGMFPDCESTPAQLEKLPMLTGVIDAVYNPLRTRLVSEARERGIAAEGGLYMLVAQAVRASEIFTGNKYTNGIIDRVYKMMLADKENIVLIGMPSSGKSTVGDILRDRLKRDFYDTDTIIRERFGDEIPEIFKKLGEEGFRKLESEAVREISSVCGAVIATGGGVPLRRDNVNALKKNGKLFYLDRPIRLLTPTHDRPLAQSKSDLERLYSERKGIYESEADVIINAECDAQGVAEKIIESINYCK